MKLCESCPIGSMYGIFTYIYHKNQPNVGKYTIHGSYGCDRPGVKSSAVFFPQESSCQICRKCESEMEIMLMFEIG